MLEKLESVERRYEELNELMAQPDIAADFERLQTLAKEQAGISDQVAKYRDYKKTSHALEETRAMLDKGLDDEMVELVTDELASLEVRLESLTRKLEEGLIQRDAYDDKDVIVEIRAGAGGDEAALFAADLLRMYARYAENRGWHVDVIDSSESGIGGFKEIIFEVKGKGAYSRLKYERGVHRVQRVPVTESSGRIHTSTATIAVLPEVEDVEVDINPEDIRIDIFCAGGHGGLPTGITAVCQDERSQGRNKTKAMAVLRARILDQEERKHSEEIAKERRSQVGTGDRSEKIRTYNFPQGRVSDHRIGLTLHNLEGILGGELDSLIDALTSHDRVKWLEEA